MSDTQSSQQVQIRVEQKIEAKLRDLLERAKLITPFYDDDALLAIHKDCYGNDQVFLNKLEIIAKNHKQAEQTAESQWIIEKKHHKQRIDRDHNVETRTKRQKYNFLEDKVLIQRAKNFDPEKQRELEHRPHQEYKERHEAHNKWPVQQKRKYQQKEEVGEQVSPTQPEKKLKFKEKDEPTKIQTAQQKHHSHDNDVKQAPKPVQKKEKFVEKKVEKKQEIKPQVVEHPQKKQHQKDPHPQVSSKPSNQEIKKQGKVQYKPKETKETKETKGSKVETPSHPLPVKVEEKPQPKSNTTKPLEQKAESSSPKKLVGSQKELDENVRKQFDASCKQNSFILKFIPPSQKLQKVSYIREPNGTYQDVKVREVLSRP